MVLSRNFEAHAFVRLFQQAQIKFFGQNVLFAGVLDLQAQLFGTALLVVVLV